MGLKISFKKSKEISHPGIISPPSIINLHNWRAVIELGDRGIYVITREYRLMFLQGLTFPKFNYLNSIHASIEIPYEIMKNYISCSRCHGVGKSDWVGVITGDKQKFWEYIFRFKRGGKTITVVEHDRKTFLLSRPSVKQGEEICPSCFGSGIYFKGGAKFLKEMEI